MSLKTVIKICIPHVIVDTIRIIINQLRNPLNSKASIKKIKLSEDNFCIIANGPSLSKSVEKYKDFMKVNNCLIVNDFPQSNLFEELQPNYYLLLDPTYFKPLDKLSSYDKNSCLTTCNMFLDKLTWDITVLLPLRFEEGWFEKRIKESNYVKIAYFNNSQLCWNYSQKAKFKCWNKNLLRVPGQTVINTAVYLCLFWNVKNTYIFGLDSDFFTNLEVDQETNILYHTFSHFYGKEKKIVYKDNTETIKWDYSEYVAAFANMFVLYKELRQYADFKKLSVFNASEYSMVDAFERKKPN